MSSFIKKRISIQSYEEVIKNLIELIPKNKYEYVYGIPRGGLIIATYISYQIDIDIMVEYGLNIPKEKVLVVDDLVDTGITLEPFVEIGYDTATLFHKNRSTVQPTFCPCMNIQDSHWLVFPYERDDEPINRTI